MHLNSNDIFSQIGLVVSNQESSSQPLHYYTVYLQIELSQGKNQLLQIRNYDDPHQVSVIFCRKHRLNQLAKQIVENKIVEAKQKEERRMRESLHDRSRESNSFMKSSIHSKYRDSNKMKDSLHRNAYMSRQVERSMRSSLNSKSRSNNRSFNISKSNTGKLEEDIIKRNVSLVGKINKKTSKEKQGAQSPKKSPYKSPSKSPQKVPKESKKKPSPKKQKAKKRNPNIGNQLYARAMVKSKMLENQRKKRKEQQLMLESKELTFQPKINPVSSKIVQFRKQYGEEPDKQKEKENKRLALNTQKSIDQLNQIKECTFKPQINRVSDLISQNRNAYKDQFDHFTTLYKQAEIKKEKMNAKIEDSQERQFQPKINTRSSQAITETFQQRLEKSIIRKKELKEGNVSYQQYSFKPKIGRGPKNSRRILNSDSSNEWWNQLHSQKLKNSQVPSATEESSTPTINPNSNVYFQNLVEKRTSDVFKVLDSDQDGFISPDSIAIERLTKNQLVFLRPLFQEMDELEAYLDFTQFKKALNMLLSQADVHTRGQFLTQKPKREEKSSFAPQINKKSKQMAMTRITPGVEVFDQLYEKGLKEMQRKEYHNQKIREHQESLEMEECSFKPLLNNTSKYYIDKVLGKKISKFDEAQGLL